MFQHFRCALGALAGVSALASGSASAQWLPGGSCGCGSAPAPIAMSRPISSCSSGACGAVSSVSCAPAMQAIPVTQQCYRTVPVTEYQQVRERVRRPVTEVEYVEQPCTTYRPVTETRTVDVPVTTYQDVVEYKQVATNGGHWQTRYQSTQKMSACQYDPRNDIFGFFNRTGYSIRSAFTPNMVATREFVPQNCVAQVPVTRRVPQTCVQQQSYQVTKYVPETTTRKVAVNKVRWVEDEVVALKPVTVMKTIASGTQTAWTYAPAGATVISSAPISNNSAISLAPSPDPISAKPSNSTNRTATRPRNEDNFDDRDQTEPRSVAPRTSGAIEKLDRLERRLSQVPRESRQPAVETMTKTEVESKPLFVAARMKTSKFSQNEIGKPSSVPTSVARTAGWQATSKVAVAADDKTPILLPPTAVASTR